MEEMKVFDIVNKFIIPQHFKVIVRQDKYFEVYRDGFKKFYDEMFKKEYKLGHNFLSEHRVKSIIIDYELEMLIIKI